jgi:hypothetical protein
MSSQYDGDTDIDIEVEIEAQIIANALLANASFIRQVTTLVLVELTRQARRQGNLLGKWAQKKVPAGVKNQITGTKHLN